MSNSGTLHVQALAERSTPSLYIPAVMEPLPPGTVVALPLEELFDAIGRDGVAGRFFLDEADRSAAEIILGRYIELDPSGSPRADLDSFPAYFVAGGHGVCTPSGAPGGKVSPVPCTTEVVVNAVTREVVRVVEIGSKN